MTGPGGRTALIGRDAELEALTRRMLAAQSGAGGFVLISGEAGIGKTRLLGEVARRGRARRMTVLLGRAVAGGGPYRPIAEALVGAVSPGLAEDGRLMPYRSVLGRLLPGWAGEVGPDHSLVDPVVVLGEAVLELLGVIAEPNGAVVLLDDLHWADPDSLALVSYLIGRIESRPVLLIGAARDEERAAPALGELPRASSCSSVKLARLSSAEVAALARTRADGLADASLELVVRAADGLPLLVEEMVDALACGASPGVPHTVAALTQCRMNTLSASAREVLQTAAVLGAHVEWQLLPAASGRSDDDVAGALREAVDASLLVFDPSSEGSLRWRHALTQDAVLAELLPPERAIIARRAAAALDTGDLSGERLSLVARLYAQCGRRADAARMLLALARTAVDAGGLGSAEDALGRARRLAPDDHEVTIELVRVLGLAGRADEATALGTAILDVVGGEQLTVLCLHLARAAVAAERWGAASRLLAPVAGAGDPRVDAVRAHVALGTQGPAEASTIARAAAAQARETGHPEAVCEALEILGRALRVSDPDASDAAFDDAEQYADQHDLTVWRIRALSELGANDMLRRGRLDRLEEARRRALDAGMLATAATLDVQISACICVRHGHVAAVPFAERAIAGADRLRLAPLGAIARYFAALGHLFAGDNDRVASLSGEARALAEASRDIPLVIADLDGLAAWLDGNPARAVALLDANRAGSDRVIARTTPSWGLLALLRTTLGPTDGREPTKLRAAGVAVQAANAGALSYVEAVTAARAGNRSRADELVAEGDGVLTGHPAWRHILRLAMAETAAKEGFGDPQGWLRAALADLEGSGEVRLLHLCRALMRRLGLAVPRGGRRAGDVPAALRTLGVTPRELEVLDLVEHGLTNRQVAAQLYLSPRTVETHVASLLAKTGLPSRADLRAGRARTCRSLSP